MFRERRSKEVSKVRRLDQAVRLTLEGDKFKCITCATEGVYVNAVRR